MRFGSVCSGIEAASAAWLPLGWRHAFLSEIEAFPRAVLKHHYPEAPLHGDFTTIQAGEYDPIDLLVGGTPCQDFSVAGLRAGMAGDRGNLTLQFLTLARRLRPRWVVWENVPGVLSSNGGRDFGAFLGGLGELGYGWAYRTLDAQFFGVAQRRRRVFVVGYLGDWRRAAAVLFERHCLSGHPAPSREAGEGVAPPIAGCANGGGANGPGRTADDAESLIVPILDGAKGRTDKRGSRDGSALGEPGDPMFTLRDGSSHAIAFALRGREGGAMPEVGGDQAGSLRAASGGSTRDYVALEVVGTLAANMGQGNQFAASGQFVAFSITPSNSNKDYNAREVEKAQAITSGGNRPSARGGDLIAFSGQMSTPSWSENVCDTVQAKNPRAIAGASAVRRLTPRECERLQGFPDDYTLIPWRKGVAPDGPRYKALGNSMAVPVMAWIGRRIEAVEVLQPAAEIAA